MANRHDENEKAAFLDLRHDPIVADPVSPQTLQIAEEWLAKPPRILGGFDAFAKES